MKIGIYYGSMTGNTASAASQIGVELQTLGEVEVKSIADVGLGALNNCDLIILGTSTWGLGEIQDDWDGLETLPGVDLSGKKVAVFGTGDQEGYADTFVDAIGMLADAAEKVGGTLIGLWPTEGYQYTSSVAQRGNYFAGLALDDDNQSSLTAERIKGWATQLSEEINQ